MFLNEELEAMCYNEGVTPEEFLEAYNELCEDMEVFNERNAANFAKKKAWERANNAREDRVGQYDETNEKYAVHHLNNNEAYLKRMIGKVRDSRTGDHKGNFYERGKITGGNALNGYKISHRRMGSNGVKTLPTPTYKNIYQSIANDTKAGTLYHAPY